MVPEGEGGAGAATRRKKKGYAWAVAYSRSVRVHVSATRAAAVIPEHFSDRLRAPTAADGYSPYDGPEVRQRGPACGALAAVPRPVPDNQRQST